MIILRSLIIFACAQLILASAGQGIGTDENRTDEELSSKEVAEAVKQEVYLKTANIQPIQIDRLRKFETKGVSTSIKEQSLHRTLELDEVTKPPRRFRRWVSNSNTDSNTDTVHSLSRTPELDEVTKAPIGYGTYKQHNYNNPGTGIGTGTTGVGIGSGTTGVGRYEPEVGHGVKVGGKPPAIGSGVVDDISDVGYGSQTTRRTFKIGEGLKSESDEEFGIGKGTTDNERGDRVILDSDKDGINTALGDEVKIGSGVRANRARRNSQFDRFDTGFAKECNSYYGRVICYRVYTNPSISTPSEYTCWRVSHGRKNCTEVDNIVYLKNKGFQPDEYEIPRPQQPRGRERYYESNTPTPRNRENYESVASQNSQYPRARDDDGILHGQSGRYEPYSGASSPRSNNQGSTHRFVTSSLKLGQSNSLELDDNRELYRSKRATKTRKPYYIPPDYEILDEYEQTSFMNKPTKIPHPF